MKKCEYVIWDWNGTLLDDLKASIDAVNGLLDEYKKPHITLEQYYSYVDTPIYKFYERLFDLSKTPMSEIKPIYARYYESFSDTISLAEGMESVLDMLDKQNIKQYILSAAHEKDILHHAERLGIVNRFVKIDASSDYDAGSKTERGLALLKSEGIDAEKCLMIGDTLHDFECAEAMGVDCVLYSKGHTDLKTLEGLGRPVFSSMIGIAGYIFK